MITLADVVHHLDPFKTAHFVRALTEKPTTGRELLDEVGCGRLGAQGKRGHLIGEQVETEDLQHTQGLRNAAPRQTEVNQYAAAGWRLAQLLRVAQALRIWHSELLLASAQSSLARIAGRDGIGLARAEVMRILVGSDLSEASDEAVCQALALARDERAELAVCHVLPEPQVRTLFPQEHERDLETLQSLEPRFAEALRAQVARLSRGEAVPVSVFVEHGAAYGELVDRAEAWAADLIVIGNHGRAQLKHLFLGSVAEQVARHAPCSALVARAHGEGVVLVATDLSDPAQLALAAGAREAARRNRPLVVVHATDTLSQRTAPAMALLGVNPTIDPPEVTRERDKLSREIIESALNRLAAKAEIRIVNGDPAQEILRLVESLPAELLVLGTRGRSDVARIMLGGVAANMVRNAPCSVWAARPRST